MTDNRPEDRFSKITLKFPIPSEAPAELTQKELRKKEYDKRIFIDERRMELRNIVQTLTNLADQIPDIRTQVEIFQQIRPTNKVVIESIVPDSIEAHLNNLTQVADSIAAKLPEQDIKAKIVEVKNKINRIISELPQ